MKFVVVIKKQFV